jgi:hypothetical protein
MKQYDIIIGIDPDVDKSGVARIELETRKIELVTMRFPYLMDYLELLCKDVVSNNQRVKIVVEAGWKNSISNYHSAPGSAGQRIAKNVGANHEVGRKIVEMCRHYGFDVSEIAPLKKCWRGKDGKITHEELAAFTGIKDRSNQESRDAALLAWVYAGLPIKIK